MKYDTNNTFLKDSQWDVGFVGQAVDVRGEKSIELLNNQCKKVISIIYLPKLFKITINKVEYELDKLSTIDELKGIHSIILDSTTLGFAETLLLCQSLFDSKILPLSILYVEPNGYKIKQSHEILHRRDFELSNETIGYEAIPGHALSINSETKQKIVFLCGYESERIDRAIEDSDIISSNCSCIFGVPAIYPGWEMDSFANNISIIKDKKLSRDISFCSALNPKAIIKKLNDYYESLEEDEQLFVVPLATKPMNLGACLFLISKPKEKVAVLYDHPRDIKNRAIEIAQWHLYTLSN